MDWTTLYADAARCLPDLARTARPVLAGLTACVDKSAHLSENDIRKLQRLSAYASGPAKAFADIVLTAISSGRGGEHAIDWRDGPAWIEDNLRTSEDLGGTGARVAQTLASLGSPAVLCLASRSPTMLQLVHPDVLLSSPSGLRRAGETPPDPSAVNVHYILEFREGTRVGGGAVPRSDRLILRFGDLDLESSRDGDFVRLGRDLAGTSGAGVLSGFNELPPDRLRDRLRSSRELSSAWRENGLRMIHMELAGYRSAREMRDVTTCLAENCDSLGMNAAELRDLIPVPSSIPSKLVRAADEFGLARVCAHGDRWAMSLTTNPPEKEMLALLSGSIVASSLARRGEIDPHNKPPTLIKTSPPPGALFGIHRLEGRWLVACPVPYVERPAVTVGLGDSFLAGTMLVLGNESPGDVPVTTEKAHLSD